MSSNLDRGEITQETAPTQVDENTLSAEEPLSLSKDVAFHLLQNSRRRALLRYVFDKRQETFRVREVARRIAAWEDDVTVQQLDQAQYHRVSIALRQNHLPKFDERDIIEFRQSAGEFSPRPRATLLESLVGDQLATTETHLQAASTRSEEHSTWWSEEVIQRLLP